MIATLKFFSFDENGVEHWHHNCQVTGDSMEEIKLSISEVLWSTVENEDFDHTKVYVSVVVEQNGKHHSHWELCMFPVLVKSAKPYYGYAAGWGPPSFKVDRALSRLNITAR